MHRTPNKILYSINDQIIDQKYDIFRKSWLSSNILELVYEITGSCIHQHYKSTPFINAIDKASICIYTRLKENLSYVSEYSLLTKICTVVTAKNWIYLSLLLKRDWVLDDHFQKCICWDTSKKIILQYNKIVLVNAFSLRPYKILTMF